MLRSCLFLLHYMCSLHLQLYQQLSAITAKEQQKYIVNYCHILKWFQFSVTNTWTAMLKTMSVKCHYQQFVLQLIINWNIMPLY